MILVAMAKGAAGGHGEGGEAGAGTLRRGVNHRAH
eukprot:CAMPEP_0179901052 /NCGR_PEP_ID=MMETSP0982-20121206/39511_1 /TAXON_ID=483367 /ORGANISM="non described non described, Strain CCMP 2436" /LENGTH=34 /DNA_ID= /DNA_START= /DNA_END= /DNA_ORIENTATION=